MTSKNNSSAERTFSSPQLPRLPSLLKLSSLTNQPQASEVMILKSRVDEL